MSGMVLGPRLEDLGGQKPEARVAYVSSLLNRTEPCWGPSVTCEPWDHSITREEGLGTLSSPAGAGSDSSGTS